MAALCGLLPEQTSDIDECRRLALRDGAAVLTAEGMKRAGLDRTSEGCTLLPPALWGDQLWAYALPTEISIQQLPPSAGAAAGRQVTFESYQGRPKPELEKMIAEVMEGTAGEERLLAMSSTDQAGGIDYAHTDGWGNAAPGTNPRPDWFFLVCEEWDEAGGESFLVDGQGVFDAMPPDVQHTLLTVPLPGRPRQGEPRSARPFLSRGGPANRLIVRNGKHSIMATTGPEAVQAIGEEGGDSDSDSDSDEEEELYPAEARRAIEDWSHGVAAAQLHAPRFKLQPGQAVLIDNFRCLREYLDSYSSSQTVTVAGSLTESRLSNGSSAGSCLWLRGSCLSALTASLASISSLCLPGRPAGADEAVRFAPRLWLR